MFNKQLNKEFEIKKWQRYRPIALSCQCGCGAYKCSVDLIGALKEIQYKVGDEELEFGNTPCCKEYAYSIGINQDTSPYVNGTAVEVYKPNSISREQFEDILHSDDLGISQIIYDEDNEIYYINVGDEDDELPY